MIINKAGQRRHRFEQLQPAALGLSLTELLVAMTLGLILTSGMFAVFLGNQRSSSLNTEMSNMQESIRFALNAMSEDIRMAGYQGCMDLNGGTVQIIALDPPTADLRDTVISGAVIRADGTWFPEPQLGVASSAFSPPTDIVPRAGTHTIAVQYARNPGSGLAASQSYDGLPSSIGPLVLSRAIDVEAGDLALVSTCESGEIFRVSDARVALDGTMTLEHAASHNERGSFQQIYGMPANIAQTLVLPFTTRVYYVGDSGEDKPDGSALYALYQQTMPFDENANPPVVLVEGVENMRIQFGIGSPNGQLQYVQADDDDYDAKQIRSVRIGLLMASYEPLLDSSDTSTYALSGTAVSVSADGISADTYPDDKRLRLAFNTTVTVRNRRPQN